MAVKKGQNLRLLIGDVCIAAATSCSFHIGATLEDSSTKDSTGNWQEQECTGKNWDCSADALVVIDATETAKTAFDLASMVGTTVTVKFQETQGDKNREAVSSGKVLTGTGIINDWSCNAPNKQNATYTVQIQGTGALS